MDDRHLVFLNKFLDLYRELISHDGFGDIEVRIRNCQGRQKDVFLFCGREYRFRVPVPSGGDGMNRYRVTARAPRKTGGYQGVERRSGRDRRDGARQRRQSTVPRHFKLERRVSGERRSGYGRRRDDL